MTAEERQQLLQAHWDSCVDARTLLGVAAPGTPRRTLIAALCACVRAAITGQAKDKLADRALERLERWSRGEAGRNDVKLSVKKLRSALVEEESALLQAALLAALSIEEPAQAVACVEAAALALSEEEGTVYNLALALPSRSAVMTHEQALAQLAGVLRTHLSCPQAAALAPGAAPR